MAWVRRLSKERLSATVPEPLSAFDYTRVARIRLVSVGILILINLSVRINGAGRPAYQLALFDTFLALAVVPQAISVVLNAGALWAETSAATWRKVSLLAMTTEVWWACCAAWIEGVSSRPLPFLVLLILVYRILMDRYFGVWALGLAVALHGGLVALERLGLVPANPLGADLSPTHAGATFPAARLLWIPATYAIGWVLANHAVVRLRRAQAALASTNEALRIALAEVSVLAREDGLTHTWNRRYFQEQVEREMDRVSRLGQQASLLMLDLDGFKGVNDALGHAEGDRALVRFSEVIRGHVRKIDVVARYGGEEFVVLLPSTDLSGACDVAERIRAAQQREGLHATVSIGVADTAHNGACATALLAAADAALYEAKRGGRNRVCKAP